MEESSGKQSRQLGNRDHTVRRHSSGKLSHVRLGQWVAAFQISHVLQDADEGLDHQQPDSLFTGKAVFHRLTETENNTQLKLKLEKNHML